MRKMVITVKGFPGDFPNIQKVYQHLDAAVFSSTSRVGQDEVETFLNTDQVPNTLIGKNIYASVDLYGKFYLGTAERAVLISKLGEKIKKMCLESRVFVKMKTDKGQDIFWDSVDGIEF
ncbi:hypothetical protein A2303_00200 [Candidatus Falkowbacteria bacterium RIFOXYB2_FULL_47_14]|uniref:Uncharacterized protein n=1 Tax=Candidatus Falkowbacteria bacterium RIFOXYA2_FULL_47_19 TaxID=1797994 RepID=A0A1F5SNV6_9BACT|nr:MAG: hypothetical protein A2227_01480 [Candidatus Falkowbacteria bacterium RIFOXYA2_FULL_47_19]OGF36800.1 MAG: hypothetical protein A2468_03285 [Candidatus Falkowbacteria bacterium RIFOXYC2_FULL_46_15]OGF44076.1 MAG: hypothetical protein A2303_00200 [Candidatus Falkowbacteria bacterium RIFOXYB2_FULL_47_14]